MIYKQLNQSQERKTNWGKCALGTAGGAGTGGLGGASAEVPSEVPAFGRYSSWFCY
ncbi:hypothetical protein [Staphylococcus epidermidis]|uniref:hypothetical protein n=1 Tax=Staphylococcus epidermidis TaxID=1282 RepID=UPI00372196EC